MIKSILQFISLFLPKKSWRQGVRSYSHSHNAYTRKARKTAQSIGSGFVCNRRALLNKHTVIGDCVRLNGVEIQGSGPVQFGSHICAGSELLIIAQNHNYDGGSHIPYTPKDYIYKDIKIGNYVWIGSRVTILPGTEIGEGAIIQAGAVVHGKIPPCAIAGGNPAQVFKYRDTVHFDKLKKQKKFY